MSTLHHIVSVVQRRMTNPGEEEGYKCAMAAYAKRTSKHCIRSGWIIGFRAWRSMVFVISLFIMHSRSWSIFYDHNNTQIVTLMATFHPKLHHCEPNLGIMFCRVYRLLSHSM